MCGLFDRHTAANSGTEISLKILSLQPKQYKFAFLLPITQRIFIIIFSKLNLISL